MSDLGRAKAKRHIETSADADGTRQEDDRQLRELLLSNAVQAQDQPGRDTNARSSLSVRLSTLLTMFVAMPFALLAYSVVRDNDDFYS